MPCGPEIEVVDHHPRADFPVAWLRSALQAAVRQTLEVPGGDASVVLPDFSEIEVSLIDDATIDQVHREFMGVAGATDVITFQHGEILVSLDTASAQAAAFGQAFEREVLLYGIHGLLHLNGFDDTTEAARERMHRTQREILDVVLAECPGP